MDPIFLAAAALVALIVVALLLRRGKSELPPDAQRAKPDTGQESRDEPAVAAPKAAEAPAPGREAPSPSEAAATDEGAGPETTESPVAPTAPEAPPEPATAELEIPDIEIEAEADAGAAPPAPPPSTEDRKRDVARLKKGLAGTRGGFISRLAKLFGGAKEVDTDLLEEIEAVLITADIGVKTTDRILEQLRQQMADGQLGDPDAVWTALRAHAKDILANDAPKPTLEAKPSLIMVAGVNGVGKTTTIGKLASRYEAEGKRVLLAAGDTYRAAAVKQLEVWGERVGCPVVKGKEGADPGSVIFDAVKRAEAEGYDLVIADTAGRLHTKQPLMEELRKVARTTTKALGGRDPDEILLVLDSTTGQNAVQQMHMFRDVLAISGVVLTKLDGTAKGGVVLGIVDEHKVPIRYIGLGERVEDLREFDVDTFIEALFEKPDGETLAA